MNPTPDFDAVESDSQRSFLHAVHYEGAFRLALDMMHCSTPWNRAVVRSEVRKVCMYCTPEDAMQRAMAAGEALSHGVCERAECQAAFQRDLGE